MYKISISIIFILIAAVQVNAQLAMIEGKIADKTSNEVIPFASMVLYSEDNDKPVSGLVSGEDGSFSIKSLHFGSYSLQISYIGYLTDTINNIVLSAQNPRWNTGTIHLDISPIALEEAEIRKLSATMNNRIDRKVYTASDFETASGGNAVDILNKLPSISVDPDGVVSVRGTSDFMVYLNGKPTYMDASMMLSQLPADAVQKIEVISIPSAKYDAQGKGGIINITTRTKGTEGFSMAVNGLLGGAPWGNKTDPISRFNQNDNRWGSSVNLLYTKKNISLFGGLNGNRRNINGSRTGDARLLQDDGSYFHMVAGGERPEWFINYTANAGFEYRINEKTSLSASYFYGNREEGRSAFYVYNTFFGAENKSELPGVPVNENWIYNPNTDKRYGLFHTGNIDLNRKINDHSDLKLSVLYEHSSLKRKLDNRNYDYNPAIKTPGDVEKHFIQQDNTPLDGFRFSADYSTTLSNGQRLGIGFQPAFFSINGAFRYDTLGIPGLNWNDYAGLENAIDLQRAIYAGYFDYEAKIGKLQILAGLRLEYTDQLLKIDNPDYFSIFERATKPEYAVNKLDWFPSLHMEYKSSENTSFNMAASRRISRPPIKDMAPFLYRRHFEVYVVGDPALEPEYLTNAELSYDQKIGKQNIVLTAFYRGTDNAIFRVNTVFKEENVLIRSYTNSGNTQAFGAELNANLETGRIAKFFLGGSLYHFRVKGDIFGYQEDNSSTNWSMKGNVNLILSKSLKFTMDIDVKSATVTAQGSNEMFYMANSALSYTPESLKGWGINLKMLDILGSNIEGLNTRAYNAFGDQIFFQETEYLRYGPIAEIGISYDFNMKGKSGKKGDSEFGKKEF